MVTRAEQFAKEQQLLQDAGVDINKYNSLVNSGISKADAIKQANTKQTTTPTTTSTATSTQTSITPVKTGGPADGYANATDRNMATNASEFGGTTPTMKSTTTVAETPKVETATTPSNSLANKWNEYSYEEQQAILKANPNIQKELTNRGITNKAAPTTATTPTSTTTTPKDKWDYQDNSPERMTEIADNVNRFAITDPQLFASEEAFRNFFIDGKGRTPEQEKFLMDFYKNRKTYNELDNYTADQIGSMYVNGKIPDSYLNYLKNTNPDRYAYVMDAKAKATDKITDTAGADSIANLMGEMDDKETIWGKMVEWAKKEGLLVDKNGDLIDDRLYHEASQEEKTYAKEYSDNLARIMELQQTKRDIYDDYVKAYPGATKATLLALTNDATTEIQKEIDNLTVENTRLQGYIGYAQSERQQQDAAGKQTIANLQKDYGLYYSYSPEGMSELAQAQYAATNVTLDQADQGTYTQKQMALDSVLTPIYEQYGSIIQRSKAQVINDVIAYAEKNGVTLGQAFQDNFMTPLQSKTAYKNIQAQLNTAGLTDGISWTKIGQDEDGNDIYGFVNTNNLSVVRGDWDSLGSEYTAEKVSSNRDTRKAFMSDIADQYTTIEDMANAIAGNMNGLGDGDLECGVYVNDYIYGVTGTKGQFGNEVSQKESICDNKDKSGVKVGDAIVFNWGINEPQWVKTSKDREKLLEYGHVGYVTGIDDEGNVTMSHTVGGNVTTTTFNINGNNDYANNFAGSQTVTPKKTDTAGGMGVSASYDIAVSSKNKVSENETYAFAQRAWEADEKIRDYERKYEGMWDSALITAGDWAARLVGGTAKSNNQKAYETYKNEFVNAVLRRESGAAIGQTEFSDDEKGAIQRYFPQPGDTLEQIARKQMLRENYINNMMAQAGKASDGRTMQEIYQKNKKINYANSTSDERGVLWSYNWMNGLD